MDAGKMKRLRVEKKLTQKQLGEMCAIAEPTIRRYESGKLNPKIETVRKIAVALGVPIGELMNWADFDARYDSGKIAKDVSVIEQAAKVDGLMHELLSGFSQLNRAGQRKAVDYVNDLSEIDAYKNEP